MAMTVPEIRVFAMFPLDPANTEPSNWNWIHCLTFPLDTLNNLQFTPKHYKWIRYAIGAVLGAQGHLSFSRDPPYDVMDYDHDLRHESADLYYHTSDAEKQKFFPADPASDHTTSAGSCCDAASERSGFADFNSDVAERDGTCVLIRAYVRRNCGAAYFLPHSKGDEYIENYTQYRSRDPAGNDLVFEIDDVRNGIFLNKISQVNLGKRFAFLITPNFAMTTTDVDPIAPPTKKRCTVHLFVPGDELNAFCNPAFRAGGPIGMPDDADEWPPDILFDAAYARAVLRYFATQTMRDTLKRWKSTFYNRVITSAARASDQALIDQRWKEQTQAREQRDARRPNRPSRARDDWDPIFDPLMIPYAFIPGGLEKAWRDAAEKRAERERSDLADKVVGWATEVANACP